jgi:hypothetical protein
MVSAAYSFSPWAKAGHKTQLAIDLQRVLIALTEGGTQTPKTCHAVGNSHQTLPLKRQMSLPVK